MTTTHDPVTPQTADACGCSDFAVSRRSILRTGAALGGSFAVTQMFGDAMLRATFAASSSTNTLVVISLRGGIDGLGVVVPHGDANYYRARPQTAVAKSSLLCADSMFGLHPQLSPLTKFWQSGELAAVHAVGLPVANRSHFSAIEEVEDAAPGSSVRSGWVNRMVGLGADASPLDAVQVGATSATAAVSGPAPSIATTDITKMQIPGLLGWTTQRYSSIDTGWTGATGPLAGAMSEAVAVSKGPGQQLASAAATTAAYPTSYPATVFAEPLKQAARLIRSDVGTDVVAIDAGNWDFHTGYGTLSYGSMQSNLGGFAQALAAFLDDLGELRQRVTVVTISEFGRRVVENGSQGFDHGWGNMMLLAGAGVKGGKYYGRWPGLQTTSDSDLAVTTDYRNVLGEVVARRFPDRSVPSLFPGLSYDPVGFMS